MSNKGKQSIPDAAKIIEKFGGIRPMSAKINVAVTTIQGWKKRDTIPGNRKPVLFRSAKEHEIDLSEFFDDAPTFEKAEEPEVSEEVNEAASVESSDDVKTPDEETQAEDVSATEESSQDEQVSEEVEAQESQDAKEEDIATEKSDDNSETKTEAVETKEEAVKSEPIIVSNIKSEQNAKKEDEFRSAPHKATAANRDFTEIAVTTERRAITKSSAIAAAMVVLVVAADDGVKSQTVEAIKHAKAAKVPIIVAINKCDLPGADPQKIKNELLQYELIAEELSGDTLFTEVSATTKKNLDKLKENIALQSELLNLKTNFEGSAKGVILESRIDQGKGPVSTVLVLNGNLEKGNFFVSGNTWGKIRAMINDQGQNIDSALPSTPVEILGMNNFAFAGDDFVVVESEEKAKEINEYRIKDIKSKQAPLISANKESAFSNNAVPKELAIIVKSDVHGSSEALKNAIEKIKHAEVTPKIILSNIGVITETDVTLARTSNAIVIGFNVRPNKEAKKLAEIHKITIKFFNIIYEVLDFVNDALSGLLKPDIKEQVVGSAEVQAIFKVSKIGKVAGSKVIDGEIINNLNARLIRDGNVLYTGLIGSIFRDKNAAKQVGAGQECGITLKDFADFKEKDVIEVYTITETERRI